jgi:hypothetical protein
MSRDEFEAREHEDSDEMKIVSIAESNHKEEQANKIIS